MRLQNLHAKQSSELLRLETHGAELGLVHNLKGKDAKRLLPHTSLLISPVGRTTKQTFKRTFCRVSLTTTGLNKLFIMRVMH